MGQLLVFGVAAAGKGLLTVVLDLFFPRAERALLDAEFAGGLAPVTVGLSQGQGFELVVCWCRIFVWS